MVWGDDQYENFREDVVPAFCVLAYDDLEVPAFEVMNERGSPNVWGRPDDFTITLHGDPAAARALATSLIDDGVDMAYSYRKRAGAHFPHAILNTQLFLDYDNAGAEFPYPLVPMTVNCYGQHAIARKGGLARFAADRGTSSSTRRPDPKPMHRRSAAAVARQLQAVRQARRLRRVVELVARVPVRPARGTSARTPRPTSVCTTPWSTATSTTWRNVTSAEIVEAGQHEMLNWFCLLGAMTELGLPTRVVRLVVTDVFNSNKCFAAFGAAERDA